MRKNAKTKPERRSSRLVPTLIFGMGIIPLFIGWFLYYNPHFLSGDTTARGDIVYPPVDVREWLGEPGKWQIMLLATKGCGEACEEMIYYGRQVHEALKEERQRRVERIIFLPESLRLTAQQEESLQQQAPKITVKRVTPSDLSRMLDDQFGSWTGLHNNIFIVDPNGNLMLRHRPIDSVSGAKDLLKDMNHLLRASRIG